MPTPRSVFEPSSTTATRSTVGLAALTQLGDLRRWTRWTAISAGAVLFLLSLVWSECSRSGSLGLLLAVGGGLLAYLASNASGRNLRVIPRGVQRLAGAPPPIVEALIELAVVRDELEALLADGRRRDATDLLQRTRDWLAGLSRLPGSAQEWLARRELSAASIHASLRAAIASDDAHSRRSLTTLRRAMIEFEQGCERDELDFDPYRGTRQRPGPPSQGRPRPSCARATAARHVLERTHRRARLAPLLLAIMVAASMFGYAEFWRLHMRDELDTFGLVLVALALAPVGVWICVRLHAWLAEAALARLIPASESTTDARAWRRARIERALELAGLALTVAAAVGLLLVGTADLRASCSLWHEHLRYWDCWHYVKIGTLGRAVLVLWLPSTCVLAAALVYAARLCGWQWFARERASSLEDRARRAGVALSELIVELLAACGRVRGSWLADQPELLRTIADGLARVPELTRDRFTPVEFDVGPAQALVRRALARGGIMVRRERHALELELLRFTRALARALPD